MRHSRPRLAIRLLVVDDDAELGGLLSELLAQDDFTVNAPYAGRDGFDILRRLRQTSAIPVIVLTACGDDADRFVRLEPGAVDDSAKPFNARELLARLRDVLRNAGTRPAEGERQHITVDDIALDPASRAVLRAGTPVELTTVEFDILRALLESAGHTVPRERLAEKVLGRQFDPLDRSIDMHISKLRRKLGPRAGGDGRIKTIRSVGYIYTLPRPAH
jgi:two-component system response regulator CpxR